MACSKTGKRKHYLYDPKTNQTQALTYGELEGMTGYTSRNKPIVQLDYETNELLGEYESIREAGRELFISHESIRLNVNGETKKCIDYKFMCADDYELNHELKIEPMSS